MLISELYSAQEVSEYLLPLAMALAEDKVSQVRQESYHLVSFIPNLIYAYIVFKLLRNFIYTLGTAMWKCAIWVCSNRDGKEGWVLSN